MPLRLQIENFLTLENGEAISVAVPETGLTVGRGAGMGWVLPDASLHVSAHHFDVLGHGEKWICRTDRPTALICRASGSGWTTRIGCATATASRSGRISSSR